MGTVLVLAFVFLSVVTGQLRVVVILLLGLVRYELVVVLQELVNQGARLLARVVVALLGVDYVDVDLVLVFLLLSLYLLQEGVVLG